MIIFVPPEAIAVFIASNELLAELTSKPSTRAVRVASIPAPIVTAFGSGSLPLHAAEIQISKLSSSFRIVLICQIEELVLDDFELPVSHWRSGNPI